MRPQELHRYPASPVLRPDCRADLMPFVASASCVQMPERHPKAARGGNGASTCRAGSHVRMTGVVVPEFLLICGMEHVHDACCQIQTSPSFSTCRRCEMIPILSQLASPGTRYVVSTLMSDAHPGWKRSVPEHPRQQTPIPPTPDHGTLTAIMFRICCRVRKERQAGRSGTEHNDVCSSVLIVAHLAALLDKLNGKVHEVETARLGISCRMLATSQPEALTLMRGALCNGKSRIALNMSYVRRSVQATTAWRSRERRCGGILASASSCVKIISLGFE